MTKKTASNIFMLCGAVIWGVAFVAQGNAMDHIGPFTMGALRFLLGALVLLPIMAISRKMRGSAQDAEAPDAPRKKYVTAGVIVGVILFAGATLQQYGLIYTTAGKAGFISSLYMVLVPFAAFVVFHRYVGPKAVVGALVAVVGTFLLCVSGDSPVNIGDVYTFLGALFWTAQILAIEKFADGLDGLKFAFYEFLTCSLLSAVCMFLFERPTLEGIAGAAVPILYCGILSVGVGFTAQIICIKYTDPFAASIIMSTESVFGALAGWLLAGEQMTFKQVVGCVLMFAAVLISQLPNRAKTEEAEVQ